jgi:hypothetical protein
LLYNEHGGALVALGLVEADGSALHIDPDHVVAVEPAQTPGDERNNGDNPTPAGPQPVATKGSLDTVTQPVVPGTATANGASQ